MTKSSLGNVESLFNINSPFCIEISLRTPENQTMILETWCILFNDQLVDPTQKVCYSVYKKMSLVLRSLMCITRCTPTYQLSRRQSSDTYVLLYRMYCGEPIVHHLGENYATSKVGTVGTPIGSILINLAYRTRLTMTPQNSSHLNNETGNSFGIQIKDDHFIQDAGTGSQHPIGLRAQSDSPSNTYQMSAINDSANMRDPDSIGQHSPPHPAYKAQRAQSVNNITHDQSFSSSSSLSKRSSSNLNTIAEQSSSTLMQQQQQHSNPKLNRAQSKTVPIPMKSSPLLNQAQNQGQQTKQTDTMNESSTDEYNSSSIASTPDTMYYFKLKSAAFVPSASFTNNYYSSSLGNLNNENDLPPFVTLLSNDFSNTQFNDHLKQNQMQLQQQHHIDLAQSPPPPQLSLEYNFRQRSDTVSGSEEIMSSPCSLPNFKILDNQLQQHIAANRNEIKQYGGQAATTSLMGAIPDDFVFIESVIEFYFHFVSL